MKRAGWLLLACLLLSAGITAVHAAEAAAPPGAAPAADDHDHGHEDEHTTTTTPAAPADDHADHAAPVPASGAADDHTGDEHTAEEGHEGHDHGATEQDPAGTAVEGEEGHEGHDHGSEEAGGSHSGHAHGVDAMGLAELAAELGSVEAAKDELCGKAALEGYNLGLHIGAVFILLGVSALGAFTPVLLHISSKSSTVLAIIKLGTFFGFGTILATAFIHMLLPAAKNLNSPCLPESWNERYEAWAYLFVVLSIVFMQLIDYLIEGAYQKYLERRGGVQPHTTACHEQAGDGDLHTHHAAVVGAMASMHTSKAHMVTAAPRGDEETGGTTTSAVEAGKAPRMNSSEESAGASDDGAPCDVHGSGCKSLIKHSHNADLSQVVGIYLMEAGIIFHSVLIGITLGVTSGSAFKTLLVALSFHQFFEGFAIGAAVVDSGLGLFKSSLMSLAYAITTPTGIAIGIGMRESFNKNAETTLLVEGTFDSISTGILIYVVLVELINPLMTQSAWLRSRRWWLQALSFAAFYSGVTVMAVIGKWA